jgi:nucleotide-binding universal stress UspA family protein
MWIATSLVLGVVAILAWRREAPAGLKEVEIKDPQAYARILAATRAVADSGRSIATLCEYGEASALLHDLVQARGIDLVVLGIEGRSGLAHVLLGSVAQRLLNSYRWTYWWCTGGETECRIH